MQAVQQVVENSEFARKGLQEGLLNISAYAKTIRPQVEQITKSEIKNDSGIVMALSRYGRQLRNTAQPVTDLGVRNIVSRSNLTEIAYARNQEVQERLTTLSLLDSIRNAPFFVSTVGSTEVVIIVDSSLADTVRGHFGSITPLAHIESLASLAMQVTVDTTALPTRSYRVPGLLTSMGISVAEYITTPTELNVIVYEKEMSRAFKILHEEFLKK